MHLLIINGPNLNLLGRREPAVYGHADYDDLLNLVNGYAAEKQIELVVQQFNGEGAIIDAIHSAKDRFDGLILNPGAYTHYSYAIHDAIKAVAIDAVEVHISHIAAREEFRKTSVTAPACLGQISGLGFYGYIAAMDYFLQRSGQRD